MKSWSDYPPLLSTLQAQNLLSITRRATIPKLCAEGKLPAYKVGKNWRIDRDRLRQQFAPALYHVTLLSHLKEIETQLSTVKDATTDSTLRRNLEHTHHSLLEAMGQAEGLQHEQRQND